MYLTRDEMTKAFCPFDGHLLELQEGPEEHEQGGYITEACPLCGCEWEYLPRDRCLVIYNDLMDVPTGRQKEEP